MKRTAKVLRPAVVDAVRNLLLAIGEDPAREGLRDTPDRVARFWSEFIDHDPGRTATSFEEDKGSGSLVVVSGIRVWSLCEHHLLPFWCDIAIGYRPFGKVLGLSKFARIARAEAHKLQIQERLVADVARRVADLAGTEDVAVIGRGEHLCMTMRGARTPALMTTAVEGGVFARDAAELAEFRRLADRRAV